MAAIAAIAILYVLKFLSIYRVENHFSISGICDFLFATHHYDWRAITIAKKVLCYQGISAS